MAVNNSTSGKINSYGTQLFMLRADNTLVHVEKFKGIDIGKNAVAEVSVQDMDGDAYADNGQVTLPSGSVSFDDNDTQPGILALSAAAEAEEYVTLYVGSSNSTDQPTIAAEVLTLPTTRTWWFFDVKFKQLEEPDFALGSKVASMAPFNRRSRVQKVLRTPA